VVLAVNAGGDGAGPAATAPEGHRAAAGIMLAIFAGAYQGGMLLWRRPTRRLLMQLSSVAWRAYVAFGLGMKWRMSPGPDRPGALFYAGATAWSASLGWWFLTMYRSQQIEAGCASSTNATAPSPWPASWPPAQIQPHFLFNSLASLQHWVDTATTRAAPMLRLADRLPARHAAAVRPPATQRWPTSCRPCASTWR
jgi:hypothetical protein